MPTTATITPTLGSAPVTLQAGNYSAIDDRRFWSVAAREGCLSGGSYQVIQRAAGANMTVDVASSVGSGAVVQGDSVTAQGNYFVPPTAANVNVDIAAADATNPRNDLVVLEVKDDQHDAGGLNLARVRVITGTANASAAATDAPGANGTPALPSSCLLLAVVRVPAGVSTVTTSYINDRRPWAGGVPTYETSLPSPAVDGQEIYYRADSTNGIIWHLRLRNAFNGGNTTYPWEYLGGPPLRDANSNYPASQNSGTPVAVTSGASVTAPLKGDYIVNHSGKHDATTSNANNLVVIGARSTTVAPGSDNEATVGFGGLNYSTNVMRASFSRESRLNGVAASDSVYMVITCTSTTTVVHHTAISIRPVRVG